MPDTCLIALRLTVALITTVCSITSLVYGILWLIPAGPFETTNTTWGIILIVFAVFGVYGIALVIAIVIIGAIGLAIMEVFHLIRDCFKGEETPPALTPLP